MQDVPSVIFCIFFVKTIELKRHILYNYYVKEMKYYGNENFVG